MTKFDAGNKAWDDRANFFAGPPPWMTKFNEGEKVWQDRADYFGGDTMGTPPPTGLPAVVGQAPQPGSAPPSNLHIPGSPTAPAPTPSPSPTAQPAGQGIPGYSNPQSFNVDQLMKFLTPQSPFQSYNFDDPFSDSSTGNNPFG